MEKQKQTGWEYSSEISLLEVSHNSFRDLLDLNEQTSMSFSKRKTDLISEGKKRQFYKMSKCFRAHNDKNRNQGCYLPKGASFSLDPTRVDTYHAKI